MPNRLVSKYISEMEGRISRRTMSNAEFYGFAIPLSLIAAAGIAALSFVVHIPFLN